MNNTTSDRIVLLESTDGEIRITATEQKIYIETPFNAAFKDELKSRFRARWNSDTKEWIIAFRYRDDLDPLLYDHFGVSMIAEVTTPSLMKVSIDMTDLYLAGPLDRSELSLAGRRLVKRWSRDRKVEIADGVTCFEEDGVTPFEWPASGGSKSLPALIQAGTKYQPLGHGRLVMGITPAELDWLRENEIDFELLDGGQSAEPEPEDPQLDPEDLNGLHEDDETWMEDDDDEDRVYVQQEEEEQAEAEVEVDTTSDEDEEDNEMKKNMKDAEDFMSIDPVTMDDRKEKEMEMETKMNEYRIAETKAKAFCPPTDEAVVKAWETFAKRVAYVDDVDRDVEPESGDRRIWNVGWRDLVVWGASYRLRHEDLDEIEETIDDEFEAVVKNYLGEQTFFLDGNVRFVTREWNELMDAITHDESASPEVRQAAEDISIIAFGDQDGKDEYLEVFKPADDEWLTWYHVTGWHKPEIFTTYPTTEHGVHVTSYRGWAADSWAGDDAIISAGGYVDGRYVSSSEVEQAGLWDRLSEDVRGEMAPLAGGDPADWNDKILELSGRVSHEDEELLDAMWISAEVFGGEVTVYGTDDDVTKMDYQDLVDLGLHEVESDEDDEDEDEVDDR